jgi:hypothetical protein
MTPALIVIKGCNRLVGSGLKKSKLTLIRSVYHETTARRSTFSAMQRIGAVISVLHWYFPFTTFSGARDLAFSMHETQTVGRQSANAAERMYEPDDRTYDGSGVG